eukprot:m.210805 g.210805  ORF g.210805 m.210805 type:complete len:160 (+) comp25494_c0_seq11:97-576(+)
MAGSFESGGDAGVVAAAMAIGQGKFVVVMDDESRENEGDLVMAAQFVTTQACAFMVANTNGEACQLCGHVKLQPPIGTRFESRLCGAPSLLAHGSICQWSHHATTTPRWYRDGVERGWAQCGCTWVESACEVGTFRAAVTTRVRVTVVVRGSMNSAARV